MYHYYLSSRYLLRLFIAFFSRRLTCAWDMHISSATSVWVFPSKNLSLTIFFSLSHSLAKLSLTEDEKEKAKEDMQKMLDYVDKLDELDTSSVEPMSHIFEDENVFREDIVTNGDNHEAMLANAPKQKENQYQVPKTIG